MIGLLESYFAGRKASRIDAFYIDLFPCVSVDSLKGLEKERKERRAALPRPNNILETVAFEVGYWTESNPELRDFRGRIRNALAENPYNPSFS